MKIPDIAKKMRANRKRLGLTVKDLAKKIGITRCSLTHRERGSAPWKEPELILALKVFEGAIAADIEIYKYKLKESELFMEELQILKRFVDFAAPQSVVTQNNLDNADHQSRTDAQPAGTGGANEGN